MDLTIRGETGTLFKLDPFTNEETGLIYHFTVGLQIGEDMYLYIENVREDELNSSK